MSGYDDPNRPEWRGKRKAKNFAHIYARTESPHANAPNAGW